MQVGSMMAFIQYATQIMFALMMVSMILVMVPRAAVSAARIGEVLSMQPEIEEPVEPVVPTEERGVVEFENVTFYYPGAEAPALSDVSFRAAPGRSPRSSAASARANRRSPASSCAFTM